MVGSLVASNLGEDSVQALVARLGLCAVSLDPLRHQVEDFRFEMARTPLGVLALADQAGVGQHLDVLRHRLDGDVVGVGELRNRGVADRVTMMHDGRVIVEGTPDEIQANETVHDLYLGRGAEHTSSVDATAGVDGR
mgnify:CR=1 FL=1